MYSLNLNEIIYPTNIKSFSNIIQFIEDKTGIKFERFHIGSNFCSQYFKKLTDFFLSNPEIFDSNLPITLSIPIVSQRDLKKAKNNIRDLIQNIKNIDEVTVNDLGMYHFLNRRIPLNLGRLFFKDTRDFRVNEYTEQISKPNLATFLDNDEAVTGFEVDNISKEVDLSSFPKDKIIAVHFPYTYQTTGNICKIASLNKPIEKKFRPNTPCNMECSKVHEFYKELFGEKENIEENLTQIFLYGRTVYFLNDDINFINRKPDRIIYFPLKELANKSYEDFDSI